MKKEKNILLVTIFAIAMAYLESAVVVYLRGMYGIVDLLRDLNLTIDKYTFIEIGREAATIVMLLMISLIAGNNKPKKIGYFFLSFGIWDIFYYLWLYVFIQWPKSILDWDVLFLIPLPWWGPVLSPILISILLILTGYFLVIEKQFKIRKIEWIISLSSILIILFTFMQDSINTLISGIGDLTTVRPTNYNWILFFAAYFVWFITTLRVFFLTQSKSKLS